MLKQAKIITFSDIAACYLALQDEKVDGVVGGELGLIRFQNNTKAGTTRPCCCRNPYSPNIWESS